MPVLAKLASQDDMPGKLFTVIEEILILLVLYSDGLTDAKLQGLLTVVKDQVITKVNEEPDLA